MEETKRHLASIQKITKLTPIKDADRIELADVKGWHVVVKKGEFKVGDMVCYIEVDSLLPIRPEFAFLQSGGVRNMLINGQTVTGYRLKTVKLRGQISQGICFPLTILPHSLAPHLMLEGTDVTEQLNIVKYEMPIPTQLQGKMRGNLPSFIPKTDEPRLQTAPEILEKYKDVSFFVTEKVDGSSTSFAIKNNEFHVCSRSLDLLDDGANSIWRVAKELKIEEKMRALKLEEKIAIQGEIVGPKIQNNTLKLSKLKILFFNAYNFAEGRYLSYVEFKELFKKLELETVPVIQVHAGLYKTVDEMIKFATRKSIINPEVWLEGVVWRPLIEIRDEDLGRLSFKTINPEYLIKNES